MNRFAALLDALLFTPSRLGKLRLMAEYFAATTDPERGWALAALTGELSFAEAKPAQIRDLAVARVDPELFGWSYDFVGDLAETVSLIWPAAEEALGHVPSLAEIVESGRFLDAKVSPELLETIFMGGSPLHDGAVIVSGDTVLAAACLLPLSQNPSVSLSLGTRHRAAIGMSEDSDAVVLVVSEEDGTISLARGGTLTRGLEPAGVLSTLRKLPG